MPTYPQKRSHSVRLIQMVVVIEGDPGWTIRVGILAHHGQRLAHPIGPPIADSFGGEPVGDATSHSLGERNPKTIRPALEGPVLIFRKLYLSTHHGVTLTTS